MSKNVGVSVKCAVFKRCAHGVKGERETERETEGERDAEGDAESQRSNTSYSIINVDNNKT